MKVILQSYLLPYFSAVSFWTSSCMCHCVLEAYPMHECQEFEHPKISSDTTVKKSVVATWSLTQGTSVGDLNGKSTEPTRISFTSYTTILPDLFKLSRTRDGMCNSDILSYACRQQWWRQGSSFDRHQISAHRTVQESRKLQQFITFHGQFCTKIRHGTDSSWLRKFDHLIEFEISSSNPSINLFISRGNWTINNLFQVNRVWYRFVEFRPSAALAAKQEALAVLSA